MKYPDLKCCYYFDEICKYPHGSANEKALSDYLVSFAKEHGLEYYQDGMYNVAIYKKASEGYENSAPLLLQAHMDMVCEANKDTVFDFEKDPLKLEYRDGWLYASGTTLGADDGSGVAYMLAILDDETLPHPPLECVFTVQEEIGLCGALGFDKNRISAKRMVCLDGGGEVSTGISSAGGTVVTSTIKGDLVSNDKKTYCLSIRGLSGGHSGGEIHKEKGNSNKLALRILKELRLAGIRLNVVSLNGGLKDNAIPRECDVVFASDDDFKEAFASSVKDIATELEFSDSGFKAEISECEKAKQCFDDESSEKIIDYIFLLPDGFMHRSMAIEGLTVTSLNLGILRTNGDEVVITDSLRSAMDSGISNLVNVIQTLAKVYGVKTECSNAYPGWNYVAKSELREKLRPIIQKFCGKEMVEVAAQGGNECGVFNSYGVEDIITYGPVNVDIHTPNEHLNLASFANSYKVLCELVKECK